MGVGNTLTLLNGRRLVNSAGYQTVFRWRLRSNYDRQFKSYSIYGIERVELLKDGASAIYGADAVAGVVNNVVATDFVGFDVAYRQQQYDHFAAQDDDLLLNMVLPQWRTTNISVI